MDSHHLNPGYPWFYPDDGDMPFPVDLHYHVTYCVPGVALSYSWRDTLAVGEIFKHLMATGTEFPWCRIRREILMKSNQIKSLFYYLKVKRNNSGKFLFI